MDAKINSENFFWMMLNCGKSLAEIPHSCSQGECGVLAYLEFSESALTPSELGNKLNVSLPRIGTILNSLENKELIIKDADNEDKRKSIIRITEKGKEIVSNKRNEAINNLTKIFEKLDENERKEYIRLTQKIVNIIEDIHK